jgi:hypothetical protein
VDDDDDDDYGFLSALPCPLLINVNGDGLDCVTVWFTTV